MKRRDHESTLFDACGKLPAIAVRAVYGANFKLYFTNQAAIKTGSSRNKVGCSVLA